MGASRILLAALVLASIVPPTPLAAQANPSALYVEAGGNGLLYSVNYEGRFANHFSARVGFAFFNVRTFDDTQGIDAHVGVMLMPLMGNVLIGNGSHRLEVGAGPLVGLAGSEISEVTQGPLTVEMDDFSIVGLTSAVGYRWQRPDGGILFRAMLTPFYSGTAQLWGGISLGLSL